MQFYNKTFENVYLKLITESAEEGVQFKYICKDCNTGFTDEDGFAEGDACPCKDCEGTLQEFTVDGLDAQPTAYEADKNEEAEDTDECDMQDDDLQDDDLCDMQDDEFEDDQDEDLQDEQLQDEDLQDDDLCDMQDEDLQDEQLQDEDLQDDDLCDMQDEDADDEAADEQDEEGQDDEESSDDEQPEVKLVSFTTEDANLIELLNQVQNGEIKLVAVPVDFAFDEEEMNENPAITMDTVANFAIEDMDDEQEEQTEEGQEDGEETDEGEAAEEQQEIAKESKKKDCCCSAKPAKPTKYGIY